MINDALFLKQKLPKIWGGSMDDFYWEGDGTLPKNSFKPFQDPREATL